jgi:hypothetical protein
MGRQVRFLFSDDEVHLLEDHLRQVGAVFIPRWSTSPAIRRQPDLAPPPGSPGLHPNIIRAVDLPKARREYVPTPLAEPPMDGYWALDRESVPDLDYVRGKATRPGDAGPLDYGRLWYPTVWRQNGEWVPVEPEFASWANGILHWVRRTFRYERDAALYVGPPRTG